MCCCADLIDYVLQAVLSRILFMFLTSRVADSTHMSGHSTAQHTNSERIRFTPPPGVLYFQNPNPSSDPRHKEAGIQIDEEIIEKNNFSIIDLYNIIVALVRFRPVYLDLCFRIGSETYNDDPTCKIR